jgi:hypothetical protein
MSSLTREQYEFLAEGIQPNRVQKLRGNSHLEQWDIRRHLIRCFGFGGFDVLTKSTQLLSQIEHEPQNMGGKSRWSVVWAAEVRLVIKAADGSSLAVYEDGATGDSQNQPSLGDAHDQALKTALSQALKRCAVNLGDQFGLSLYNDGGTQAVVLSSLVAPPDARVAKVADDAPVRPEPGTPDHAIYDGFLMDVERAADPKALRDAWQLFKKAKDVGDITEAQYDHLVQLGATRRGEMDQPKLSPSCMIPACGCDGEAHP